MKEEYWVGLYGHFKNQAVIDAFKKSALRIVYEYEDGRGSNSQTMSPHLTIDFCFETASSRNDFLFRVGNMGITAVATGTAQAIALYEQPLWPTKRFAFIDFFGAKFGD